MAPTGGRMYWIKSGGYATTSTAVAFYDQADVTYATSWPLTPRSEWDIEQERRDRRYRSIAFHAVVMLFFLFAIHIARTRGGHSQRPGAEGPREWGAEPG